MRKSVVRQAGARSIPDYPFVSLRVVLGQDILLGSGKADLLEGIAKTGSIAAAGRNMGMSYKRAWYLIDTLNGYFHEPLVTSTKGGPKGGGAVLTATGRLVLKLYRSVEQKTAKAVAADLSALAVLAVKPPP